MDAAIREELRASGWDFPESAWDKLTEYEKSFVINEFAGPRSLEYYCKRVKGIGFNGLGQVLDAACGMGQWAIALSRLNGHVEGIDVNAERLAVARALSDSMRSCNTSFRQGCLEELPYASEVFDGVFCYGAFMFTDMKVTAREFFRVLKEDGIAYVSANALGWYAHLLFDRGLKAGNLNMIRVALRMIGRTLAHKGRNIVVGQRMLRPLLEGTGFRVLGAGAEGELYQGDATGKPAPAYPRTFYGLPGIVEILVQKPAT
jgi:SAM-dependent methyltransferase